MSTITEWEAVRAELDRLRTEIMALKKAGWDLAYCAEKFSLGLSPAIGAIAEEALGRWREVAGEKEKT